MKEKRILCIEVSGECRCFADVNTPLLANIFDCKQGLYCMKNFVPWKPITKDTCKNCKHAEYQGYTREQTIEKMAKAMCRKSNGGTCDGCSVFEEPDKERCKEIYMHPEFVDGAEAALNALLEVHNDK